jgi:hypothetical protein
MLAIRYRLRHFGALIYRALIALAAFSAVSHASGEPADVGRASAATLKAHAWQTYANIPLSFEANQGQTEPSVQFLSHGAGYSLFLRPDDAVLQLQNATLRMQLLAANSHAAVSPLHPLTGTVNYLQGSDSSKWTTGIQSFERVSYAGVYPGLDLG